jgi:sulfhydrogenase subunit alpha
MGQVIEIPHLYRVEGHGGIQVTLSEDDEVSCQMGIFEGSRFYEALLRGHPYREIPGIVCRVCAICSAAHALCSITALEDALQVEVPESVKRLRDLLNHGEMIESHALHFFMLAVPDYLGLPSVLDMQQQHGEEVKGALRLKKFGNLIQERIGGRAIHPVNMLVGGVGTWPARKVFDEIRAEAEACLRVLETLEPLAASLEHPDFAQSERNFVALLPERNALGLGIGRTIQASGQPALPVSEFRNYVNESVVQHSTAKQSLFSNEPFMVGSLARLIHHRPQLGGEAARVADRLFGPEIPPNPLLNNAAQLVELIHCCEEAIRLCSELSELSPAPEPQTRIELPKEERTGTAAMEVPRGTLFHSYTLNPSGVVVDADIVTPTAQNLAQIEADIRQTVQSWLQQNRRGGEGQLKSDLERLARAYDPCISCSTHLIDLRIAQ